MGRTISFYVSKIESNKHEHDKTEGKYCFDVECYGDHKKMTEVRETLYEDNKLYPKSFDEELEEYKTQNPDCDRMTKFRAKNEILKSHREVLEKCFKNKDLWCSKCFRNINGDFFSSTIDDFGIGHSYSDRIWRSDWNVQNLHLGSETYYTRTLGEQGRIYREISKEDILDGYKKLDSLGDIGMLYYDEEAKEECIQVLDFLSKYADDNSVRMIMEEEY
jgi:hypothetical protein